MSDKIRAAREAAELALQASQERDERPRFARGVEPVASVLPGTQRHTSKQRKKKSIRQEDRQAAKATGRRIPYSGAKDQKGDAEYAGFLLECKRTDTKSIRIDEKIIGKIYKEALDCDMPFAVQVDVDGFENKLIPSRFVILTEDDFDILCRDAGRLGDK